MGNDLVPTPSPLEGLLKSFNLPEFVAGPAGKAISRLVAGVVDIPAAWLDGFTQSIKNKTKAREIVSTEMATAAAKVAAGDTNIVARAAHNLLAKEYRRQWNKEDIALRTIELLREEPNSEPRTPEPPNNVDEDWLNVFERYAEDASSERLKQIWARVLAGEIRRPKTFSLQTLRFTSELDEKIASLFEKYVPRIVNAAFIPYPEKSGNGFAELLMLEKSGVINLGSGFLSKNYDVKPGMIGFVYRGRAVIGFANEQVQMTIPAAFLTRIGREIYKIVPPAENIENARHLAEQMPKVGLSRIVYAQIPDPLPQGSYNMTLIEELWTKPTVSSS
jgi:hypothetical protein